MNCLYQNQKIKYQKRDAKILGFMSDGKICIEVCYGINNDCYITYVSRDEIEVNSARIS